MCSIGETDLNSHLDRLTNLCVNGSDMAIINVNKKTSGNLDDKKYEIFFHTLVVIITSIHFHSQGKTTNTFE